MRRYIVAGSSGNHAANCALCTPALEVALCLKRFRKISACQRLSNKSRELLHLFQRLRLHE